MSTHHQLTIWHYPGGTGHLIALRPVEPSDSRHQEGALSLSGHAVKNENSAGTGGQGYLLAVCLSILAIGRLLCTIALCMAVASIVSITIAASVAVATICAVCMNAIPVGMAVLAGLQALARSNGLLSVCGTVTLCKYPEGVQNRPVACAAAAQDHRVLAARALKS